MKKDNKTSFICICNDGFIEKYKVVSNQFVAIPLFCGHILDVLLNFTPKRVENILIDE